MSSIVFPPSPYEDHCNKCNKDVVIVVNPGKSGIESECAETNCPIASNPDYQPNLPDGTLICFPDKK